MLMIAIDNMHKIESLSLIFVLSNKCRSKNRHRLITQNRSFQAGFQYGMSLI